MKYVNISETVAFLEMAFDAANDRLFCGKLERPMITVQASPKAYGHFTQYDAWTVNAGEKAEGRKEINIGAETLNRPIENTIATLIHEMVHYQNLLDGVKDTSRGGTYHNKRFKQTAEEHGLLIEYNDRIGWSVTQPGESVRSLVADMGWDTINLCRAGELGKAAKKKSSTRKYTCPVCGQSIRATKAVNVICGDCMVQMEREDGDED